LSLDTKSENLDAKVRERYINVWQSTRGNSMQGLKTESSRCRGGARSDENVKKVASAEPLMGKTGNGQEVEKKQKALRKCA